MKGKSIFFVFFFFLIATVVMTWPLIPSFRSDVPALSFSNPSWYFGDSAEYVWKLWWFKEAIIVRGVSPFFDSDIFYPFGYSLTLGETTPVNTVLGLPLTLAIPPAVRGDQLYYSIYHQHPIVHGYATFFPAESLRFYPILMQFPLEEALNLLREWGVGYVLIRYADYKEQQVLYRQLVADSPYLHHSYTDGDIDVYRLKP